MHIQTVKSTFALKKQGLLVASFHKKFSFFWKSMKNINHGRILDLE